MSVKEYQGDLLEANVEAIIHQCNCMTQNYSGLAATIFNKFPEANTYSSNPDPSQFGGYRVFKVENQPFKSIVNLYTQLFPGSAGRVYGSIQDSVDARLSAFRDALSDYIAEHNPSSVAMPKYIGCGLAGGNWSQYHAAIIEVAGWHVDTEFHIVEKV